MLLVGVLVVDCRVSLSVGVVCFCSKQVSHVRVLVVDCRVSAVAHIFYCWCPALVMSDGVHITCVVFP